MISDRQSPDPHLLSATDRCPKIRGDHNLKPAASHHRPARRPEYQLLAGIADCRPARDTANPYLLETAGIDHRVDVCYATKGLSR
jgi:hypothetical protein